jgi:[FeFe] hydrogenase H-cluster maturation GTPase HydF
MSITGTPLSEQLRIVLIGLRNTGKSSLMNNLFERPVSIVSGVAGTTTDPVTKSMEMAGLGPVAITDTAGLDDTGELGELRILKTLERLSEADLPVLVTRRDMEQTVQEEEVLDNLIDQNRKFIIAATFSDLAVNEKKMKWLGKITSGKAGYIAVDNINKTGIERLREKIIVHAHTLVRELTPVEGLVRENEFVILVTPIDLAAPKGRLILPQVETIRDLLDRDCAALIVKERELKYFYDNLSIKPGLVITDSQVFNKVAADIAPFQKMTSFSILFARKKWDLPYFVRSLSALKDFPSGGRVIVFEACSHHKQADDIGTVKIPRLFRQMIQSKVEFEFVHKLPDEQELKKYSLVIACGGCMATRNSLMGELDILKRNGIAAVNYGLFLAYVNGLLPRALEPFPYEHGLFAGN